MRSENPPAPANWLLKHFCAVANHEALAGDLLEQYKQGKSPSWYWRQVLAAIRWKRHLFSLFGNACVAWLLSGPPFGPPHISRWPNCVVMTLILWSSAYLYHFIPEFWRAIFGGVTVVCLASVLICGDWVLPRLSFLQWLLAHYSVFISIVWSNLVFNRKIPVPAYQITLRELWTGDAEKQRERFGSRLEQTMTQESDAELQQVYAQAIRVLRAQIKRPEL